MATPTTTRVFVGAMPLVGTESIVRALPPALGRALCLHTFVLLEQGQHQLLLLDFLPERPTHPETAAALLSGGGVNGVARARRLQAVGAVTSVAPVVRLIAEIEEEEEQRGSSSSSSSSGTSIIEQRARAAGDEAAARDLRLFANDCRTHSAAVLEAVLARRIDREDVAAWLRGD
jgi:hypothetical protein